MMNVSPRLSFFLSNNSIGKKKKKYLRLGHSFLDGKQKSVFIRENLGKLDFIKIKILYIQKVPLIV